MEQLYFYFRLMYVMIDGCFFVFFCGIQWIFLNLPNI